MNIITSMNRVEPNPESGLYQWFVTGPAPLPALVAHHYQSRASAARDAYPMELALNLEGGFFAGRDAAAVASYTAAVRDVADGALVVDTIEVQAYLRTLRDAAVGGADVGYGVSIAFSSHLM